MERGDLTGDTGRDEARETADDSVSDARAAASTPDITNHIAARTDRDELLSGSRPIAVGDMEFLGSILRPEQPSEAPGVSEWSEGDERLMKWFVGPQRESIPNTLLEPSELSDIDDRLQELMEHLTETQERLRLTTEQLGMIQTTLDATREESRRIGRKDWLLFGIGTLTTLAISGVFAPVTVVYIAKLFVHNVAHLFGEALAG